jgi:alpha/beta superfamily hydrolase
MDGVTILQEIPQCTYTWGFDFKVLLFVILMIAALASFVIADKLNMAGTSVVSLVVIAISVIAAFYFASVSKVVYEPSHYQILIEDETAFNDVMEKYNIIEQQGITYIVEERTDD